MTPSHVRREPPRWLRRRLHVLAGLALATTVGLSAVAAAQDEDDEEEEPEGPQDTFAGNDLPMAAIERAVGHDDTLLFTPVGTTSVVFRARLAGDFDAAFKPQTQSHPNGDRAEVAAYRIGRFLGMRNVVPAVPRVLPVEVLRRQLGEDVDPPFETLRSKMVLSEDGTRVRGAAIYWVPELRELGIDTERGIRRWSRWLGQDGTPPYRNKSKVLARQISAMLCFDYLIGNWDRFSGANAQGDRSGRNLLVRDHNVAFYAPLPEPQLQRLTERLQRVQRFSRRFVQQVKALDRETLESILTREDDPAGYTPLEPEQITGVMQRRRTLLSYIAALIARHGEETVLWFP